MLILPRAETVAHSAVEAVAMGRSPIQDSLAFIEARLVHARIADARHRRCEALIAARCALEAAEPDQLASPFLLTPGIEDILEALTDSAASPSGFMVGLVSELRWPEPSARTVLEPLTERELTRADGTANDEDQRRDCE